MSGVRGVSATGPTDAEVQAITSSIAAHAESYLEWESYTSLELFTNLARGREHSARLTFRAFKPIVEVGRGSFGQVVTASPTGHSDIHGKKRKADTIVAIKIMAPGDDTASCSAEFYRETYLLARVNKLRDQIAGTENILRMLRFGCDARNGLIEMEAYNFNLAGYAGTFPDEVLPARMIAPLMQQLAAGLDALHRMGILHRDIKPGNILVDTTREPVRLAIGDLGSGIHVSTRRKRDPGAYERDLALGITTHYYAAPEMMVARVDAATGEDVAPRYGPPVDWWSVGVVIVEACIGYRALGDAHSRMNAFVRQPAVLRKTRAALARSRPELDAGELGEQIAATAVIQRMCVFLDERAKAGEDPVLLSEIFWDGLIAAAPSIKESPDDRATRSGWIGLARSKYLLATPASRSGADAIMEKASGR